MVIPLKQDFLVIDLLDSSDKYVDDNVRNALNWRLAFSNDRSLLNFLIQNEGKISIKRKSITNGDRIFSIEFGSEVMEKLKNRFSELDASGKAICFWMDFFRRGREGKREADSEPRSLR